MLSQISAVTKHFFVRWYKVTFPRAARRANPALLPTVLEEGETP